MRLLPSEQATAVEKAIQEFNETGKLSIYEPCNCGQRVQHFNGGNYHDIIYLRRDSNKFFVKYDTTCELSAEAEWEEIDVPEELIKEQADWL